MAAGRLAISNVDAQPGRASLSQSSSGRGVHCGGEGAGYDAALTRRHAHATVRRLETRNTCVLEAVVIHDDFIHRLECNLTACISLTSLREREPGCPGTPLVPPKLA